MFQPHKHTPSLASKLVPDLRWLQATQPVCASGDTPRPKRFVIELTNVANPKEATQHYGRRFRHLNVGGPNERVTYEVINGGWTAGIYKDGRLSIDGRFPRLFDDRPNPLYAVTFFKFVPTMSDDYTEVMLEHFPQTEESCQTPA